MFFVSIFSSPGVQSKRMCSTSVGFDAEEINSTLSFSISSIDTSRILAIETIVGSSRFSGG